MCAAPEDGASIVPARFPAIPGSTHCMAWTAEGRLTSMLCSQSSMETSVRCPIGPITPALLIRMSIPRQDFGGPNAIGRIAHDPRNAVLRPRFGGSFLKTLLGARRERDFGARFGQRIHDGKSDAAASTCDDGLPSGEVHQSRLHCFGSRNGKPVAGSTSISMIGPMYSDQRAFTGSLRRKEIVRSRSSVSK